MKAALKTIDNKLTPVWEIMGAANCAALLAARLFVANIFFKSGMLKLDNVLNGRFYNVVEEFTDYYPVPFLDPKVAAVLGTGGEVILPVLLALGLLGRVGAAGLLVMTLVIQFAVPAEYGVQHHQHYMWMILLAIPLFHGMGRLSVDYWLVKWIRSE